MTTESNDLVNAAIGGRDIGDPFFSECNMCRVQQGIQELAEGKIVVKTMDELERMAEA